MKTFSTIKETIACYVLGVVSLVVSLALPRIFFANFMMTAIAFFFFGGLFAAVGKYRDEETKA